MAKATNLQKEISRANTLNGTIVNMEKDAGTNMKRKKHADFTKKINGADSKRSVGTLTIKNRNKMNK